VPPTIRVFILERMKKKVCIVIIIIALGVDDFMAITPPPERRDPSKDNPYEKSFQ